MRAAVGDPQPDHLFEEITGKKYVNGIAALQLVKRIVAAGTRGIFPTVAIQTELQIGRINRR
ncbi:hypothetical protein D3C80_1258660 [compost metagenome]